MAAAVVTKDTLIGDLLRIDANVAPILRYWHALSWLSFFSG